jgi:cation-transporting ATPase E
MKKKNLPLTVERWNKKTDEGLNSQEVDLRKAQGLVNSTKKTVGKSYAAIILGNTLTFFNLLGILVFILMIALKSFGNAFFFIVVLANLFLGIFQEIRAKLKLQKLSLMSAPSVFVIRNGKEGEVAVHEVVLDDIIVLKTGKQIVSDAIVVDGEIEVNEALLTGESDAIRKKAGDILLSGSFVVSGNCRARVEHVGGENYVEKLAAQAKKYQKPKSELMLSIYGIVKVLAIIIFPLAAGTFFTTLNRLNITNVTPAVTETLFFGDLAKNIVDSLTLTAGSMIGMIPSGMVLLTSTALAVSVIKLLRKNAMAQDLYCIEMLARVNVLCLDKTGTITDGTMKVEQVQKLTETEFDLNEVMANYCGVTKGDNPSAQAIEKHFGTAVDMKQNALLPFSSERKLSAVSFEKFGTVVVGAPEFVMKLDAETKEKAAEFAAKGKRVLLMAYSKVEMGKDAALPKCLTACALFVIEDSIREDAPEIIQWFKDNKVDVKVISGDNAQTVSVIAGRVGIENAEKYVSLDGMSDAEVIEAANRYTVFGRVKPDQKALLIKTIKTAGKTVGMTGDGVNDILAMKQADCAIAIAAGSEAARSVAHLVLIDSKFSSMPSVVKEGRKVVNNIQNAASLFLMKTMMTVLVTVLLLILQKPYPFAPSNLYPIEFFIIGIPAFVLALRPNERLIENKFIVNTLIKTIPSGVALGLSVALMYFYNMAAGVLTDGQITALATMAMTYSGFISLVVLCFPYGLIEIATIVLSAATTTLMFTIPFFRGGVLQLAPVGGRLGTMLLAIGVSAVLIVGSRLLSRMLSKRKKQKLTAQEVS